MSADTIARALLCGFALCGGGLALAADEDTPDADFLEYLGLWEESDEDWVIIDDVTMAENKDRSDPEPEGEESPETDDES